MKKYTKEILLVFMSASMILSGCSALDSNLLKPKQIEAQADMIPVKKKVIALKEKKLPPLPDHIILDVPLFKQMEAPRLYNGCEVTSLGMMLKFHGYQVNKNELARKIKRVPLNIGQGLKGNPNEGFVGDMENGPGLGVYHGPIVDLARQYAGDKVIDLTNKPFSSVLEKVGHGFPVWVIITTSFAPVNVFQSWKTPQGTIKITFSQHSVVITGYDKDHIYINDPYGYKNRKLDRENFRKAWEQMGSQAVSL